MRLRELLLALLVLAPLGLGLATSAARAQEGPRELFRFADPEIVESSGLAVVDGLVVTVNDSGDEARVFAVDPATGETVGVTRWSGGAVDVEALAPAGDGQVWVGDIGDNRARREQVTIVRVPVGQGDRSVEVPRYALTYPDGAGDAEALLADPRTGRVYVATKSVFGGRLYVAPRELRTDGPNELEPVGPVMPIVTGGEFTPDGRHLVLRDYARAVVYDAETLEQVATLDLPQQRQGEALAVTDRGSVLISSEGPQQPVYEVTLPELGAATSEPAPSPEPTSTPSPRGREGTELPQQPLDRNVDSWLVEGVIALVAVGLLLLALRPR